MLSDAVLRGRNERHGFRPARILTDDGDEIGVFDENLLVGVGIYSSNKDFTSIAWTNCCGPDALLRHRSVPFDSPAKVQTINTMMKYYSYLTTTVVPAPEELCPVTAEKQGDVAD